MKIVALGTGAADSINYYHSSFLFKFEDTNLLIDAGGGYKILKQLKKVDVPLEEIEHIFITHKHIDHILGVFWLLRRIGSKISKNKASELNIYCSKTTKEFLVFSSRYLLKKKITELFGIKINFHELGHLKNFSIGKAKLTSFDINSLKEEQFGCIIRFQNYKVAFFGDEPYKGHMDEYLNELDVAFLDAYCLEKDAINYDLKKMYHSTVEQSAKMATELQVKQLVLHHTEEADTYKKRKQLYKEEARKHFNGKVNVPNDLDSIQLS